MSYTYDTTAYAYRRAATVCTRFAEDLDAKILATPSGAERNELTAAAIATRECAEKIRQLLK